MLTRLNFHRLLTLLVAVLIPALMLACVSSESRVADTPPADVPGDPNVLRVGVSTNSPPLIYKQGPAIVGLEAELAQKLGSYLGKSVRFVELNWSDQIPALLENRTDIIMSGMSITKMRQVRIAFSKPYFRTGQMVLAHSQSLERIPQNYYGIRGMSLIARFGVVKDTVGETFVLENFGKAKAIIPFKTAKLAVDGLLKDRIDLLIHDGPMILMLAAENVSKGLTEMPTLLSEEYLAWGMRKNDVELLDAVNGFVDKMQSEGTLDPIIDRWIPFSQ